MFISHIMRKEPNNGCRTALTWTPEGGWGDESGADPGQHGDVRGRQKEKDLDGRTGVRYTSQQLTELVCGRVLRTYVPHGMKWIGEGDSSEMILKTLLTSL